MLLMQTLFLLGISPLFVQLCNKFIFFLLLFFYVITGLFDVLFNQLFPAERQFFSSMQRKLIIVVKSNEWYFLSFRLRWLCTSYVLAVYRLYAGCVLAVCSLCAGCVLVAYYLGAAAGLASLGPDSYIGCFWTRRSAVPCSMTAQFFAFVMRHLVNDFSSKFRSNYYLLESQIIQIL